MALASWWEINHRKRQSYYYYGSSRPAVLKMCPTLSVNLSFTNNNSFHHRQSFHLNET
jgi:hypothetical protein